MRGFVYGGVLVITVFGLSRAWAVCQCPPQSDQELQDQATFIFKGEVGERRTEKSTGKTTIALDIEDHLKGDLDDTIWVIDEAENSDCALEWKVRDTYLVYARWRWGENVTSRCMGTRRLEPEALSPNSLGPQDKLKDKMYERLEIMCMGKAGTSCCLESVKRMRKAYYLPEPENGGCPSGFVPDQLRCLQSYRWCIPASEPSINRGAP